MYPVFMLLLFMSSGLQAQNTRIPLRSSHPITTTNTAMQVPTTGTLNVVAVMVEFQPDTTRFTSGNGTFGPEGLPYLDGNDVNIDPLPHDQAYFKAHLDFARDYFSTVSGGKLNINYRVLPRIYQLDQPMAAYSPTGETFTYEKLALLIRDTWRKVEASGGFDATGLDPENTAFVIFHAGVGRDIELTGTLLDKTPQDIPSIYLKKSDISGLLNDPGFSGFPINDGQFHVTNSLIMPETLSRRGEDVSGQEVVLQLSINGLLCASIGSHLGLPDLFNTENGQSAIGRFGLMDGRGFFSYSGLFPPEPSAWEKIYLNWESPEEIQVDRSSPIELPAVSRHEPNSVARYSLSSDEYYLVENRHRDPEGSGVNLTIRQSDGTEVQQHFSNYDSVFVSGLDGFDSLFTPGVLVRADNYDFSLPGGIDPGKDGKTRTNDDRQLNGGILIWHIDEAVIRSKMASKTVNNDPFRRGVDLEEADGAQDIGRPVGSGLQATDDGGSPYDFWWKGNNASVVTLTDTLTLYQNRFGPDTHPNNNSNSGAPSFFEFYDFSGNTPVASFRIRPYQPDNLLAKTLPVDKLPGPAFTSSTNDYHRAWPLALSIYTAQSDTFLVIPTGQSTYALHLNGNGNALFDFQTSGSQQPLLSEPLVVAGTPAPNLQSLQAEGWQWDGSAWRQRWTRDVQPNRAFLSSQSGDTLAADFTGQRILIADGQPLNDLGRNVQQSERLNGYSAEASDNKIRLYYPGGSQNYDAASPNRLYTGLMQFGPDQSGFYWLTDNELFVYRPGMDYPKRLVHENGYGWPAIVDLDQNSSPDFLYVSENGKSLNGVNLNLGTLPNFPIQAPEGTRFTGTPLLADLNGDGQQEVLLAGQDSLSLNIYGYDLDGKKLADFPLYVGSRVQSGTNPVSPVFHGQTLYTVSPAGDLKAWRFPEAGIALWPGRYGNAPLNKVSSQMNLNGDPPALTGLLNKNETYNWPNPASESTHIRYQLSRPGSVRIKVISMSGTVVWDHTTQAAGGVPEEILVQTSGWGSGAYFAMVTARAEGREESKIVKIAVVH